MYGLCRYDYFIKEDIDSIQLNTLLFDLLLQILGQINKSYLCKMEEIKKQYNFFKNMALKLKILIINQILFLNIKMNQNKSKFIIKNFKQS